MAQVRVHSDILWNMDTLIGDLVKCPVYIGIPLLWTPWGPGKVSCVERCPHFRGKVTRSWDIAKCTCTCFRGAL